MQKKNKTAAHALYDEVYHLQRLVGMMLTHNLVYAQSGNDLKLAVFDTA
jgi:hypothetical protein